MDWCCSRMLTHFCCIACSLPFKRINHFRSLMICGVDSSRSIQVQTQFKSKVLTLRKVCEIRLPTSILRLMYCGKSPYDICKSPLRGHNTENNKPTERKRRWVKPMGKSQSAESITAVIQEIKGWNRKSIIHKLFEICLCRWTSVPDGNSVFFRVSWSRKTPWACAMKSSAKVRQH